MVYPPYGGSMPVFPSSPYDDLLMRSNQQLPQPLLPPAYQSPVVPMQIPARVQAPAQGSGGGLGGLISGLLGGILGGGQAAPATAGMKTAQATQQPGIASLIGNLGTGSGNLVSGLLGGAGTGLVNTGNIANQLLGPQLGGGLQSLLSGVGGGVTALGGGLSGLLGGGGAGLGGLVLRLLGGA